MKFGDGPDRTLRALSRALEAPLGTCCSLKSNEGDGVAACSRNVRGDRNSYDVLATNKKQLAAGSVAQG